MAKYYQPQRRDFTIPREMYSWQVFQSKDDAVKWLVGFGYDLSDFDIIEYDGNDIEDNVIIDAYGNTIL